MYFIPRNNLFYSFIVHLHPVYRYLLTTLVIMLSIVFWSVGVHAPLGTYIDYSLAKCRELHIQHQEINRAKHTCLQLEDSISSLETDIQLSKHKKNGYGYVQSGLLLLLDQAKKTGLTLNNYTADKKMDEHICIKTSTNFILTGTIFQIINFLKQVKTSSYLFGYDHFSLTHIDHDTFRIAFTLHIITFK